MVWYLLISLYGAVFEQPFRDVPPHVLNMLRAATSKTGSGKLQTPPRFAWWCCFGTKVHLLLLHNDLAGEVHNDLAGEV
jgi:hypothetical protein